MSSKRTFRIIETEDEAFPFGLVDESSSMIVRVDVHPDSLAAWAFEMQAADEVEHEGRVCLKADTTPWPKRKRSWR